MGKSLPITYKTIAILIVNNIINEVEFFNLDPFIKSKKSNQSKLKIKCQTHYLKKEYYIDYHQVQHQMATLDYNLKKSF